MWCVQLPDEARELDKELRGVTKEKNECVRGQDFEKVSFSGIREWLAVGVAVCDRLCWAMVVL